LTPPADDSNGQETDARRSGKVTREVVLTTALEIIDRDGAEGLSMRRLARALDRDPMILYRHAPNKAALLDGVVEVVLAQLKVDPADPDWAAQLRAVARDYRQLALAHPHVVPLLVTRPLATPLALRPRGTLRPLEDVLVLLTRAGFSGPDALHIYRALFGFLHGHVLNELQELVDNPDETDDLLRLGLHRLPIGEFPLLRSLAPVLAAYDGAAELERGLDILLTGLAITLPPPAGARPASPAGALSGADQLADVSPPEPGRGVVRMRLGDPAVQRDGGTGDGRPPAPHGGEAGNGEPGDDDDSDEVDDAEERDVAVARHQKRPAHGDDVERDDQKTIGQPDAVGEVVRGQLHADRATDHRRQQDRGDDGPDQREGRHQLLAPSGRLERDDGQGDEYRQHDEGDQQVGPERDLADPARHMTLKPQPDEGLDELVGAEQHGYPRHCDELAALSDMTNRIDAYRADQQAATDVSLGREAHVGVRIPAGAAAGGQTAAAAARSRSGWPARPCR
jgi:AcrR family transcriptional regulator